MFLLHITPVNSSHYLLNAGTPTVAPPAVLSINTGAVIGGILLQVSSQYSFSLSPVFFIIKEGKEILLLFI